MSDRAFQALRERLDPLPSLRMRAWNPFTVGMGGFNKKSPLRRCLREPSRPGVRLGLAEEGRVFQGSGDMLKP